MSLGPGEAHLRGKGPQRWLWRCQGWELCATVPKKPQQEPGTVYKTQQELPEVCEQWQV